MLKPRQGQTVPEVGFPIRVDDEWQSRSGTPPQVTVDNLHIDGVDEPALWRAR